MSHQTEIEYKLTADDADVLAAIRSSALVQRHLVKGSEIPAREFEGRYYDTQDLQLNGMRWSFRARKEGDRCVAALKLASQITAGLLQCEEYQIEIDGWLNKASDLPDSDLKTKLATQLDLDTPIQERVRVCMQRTQFDLEINGTRVEMVTDHGVISANNRSVTLCEVELERREGKIEAIDGFVAELVEKFALRPSTQSKHSLGLALFQTE